jgi:hypothetical protein
MTQQKRSKDVPPRQSIIDTGDGGAAAIVAGVLALALVAVAIFYVVNITRTSANAIDISGSKISMVSTAR